MTDYRVRQSIQERFDVDFPRHGKDPLLAWRRRITWLCGFAALVIVSGFHLTGNKRIYESRPVSRSHQYFENNCQACHDTSWQPLRRLFLADLDARSVSEQACRNCHLEQTHDHSPLTVQGKVRDCIECHREHLGRHKLAEVTDQTCTQCHAELETTEDSPHFARQISSFAGHPEFFILDATRQIQDASRHQAASQVTPPKNSQTEPQRPVDVAQLRFNHALHLADDGVLLPPDHPDYTEQSTMLRLQCSSCHELDDAGRYMQPINYEAHCSDCHQLHFDSRLAEIDPQLQLQRPLPHGDPQVIRDLLRSRLLSFAERYPEKLSPRDASPNSRSETRLPHKVQRNESPSPKDASESDPPTPPDSVDADSADEDSGVTAEQKLQWVREQLQDVEKFVFQSGVRKRIGTNRLEESVQFGCGHCHVIREPADGSAWDIAPPGIPDRWMPHSRFRHDRHDTLLCVNCHYREKGGIERKDPNSIYASRTTTDVLMPSIATCRECHGASGGTAGSRGTRADCVLCHGYHHRRNSSEKQLTFDGPAGYADGDSTEVGKP